MVSDIYKWDSFVRDYELDGQGIVNNATYINYLEQCRNEYARSLGIDFAEYHKAGYIFVVAGIEIQYRQPLKQYEHFYVTAAISGYEHKRVHFNQEIIKVTDGTLVAKAIVHTACLDYRTGKSSMPDMLKNMLDSLHVEA